ncbi:MAG: HNH endonuclease [Candidatus Acidiferrum sp.]
MKNKKLNGVPVSEPSEAGRYTDRKRQQGCRTPKEIDAESLWKQIEDVVVPRLRLSVIDHVVYFHLVRHCRLEGKRRLRFSIPWLARNIHLSTCPTREAVRRLAAQGALRLIERSKAGHVAEVRLPEEIRGVRTHANRARETDQMPGATDIESVDFLKTLKLRRAIHARERGKCFYCLRQTPARLACLDHVVPRAKLRCNSYRNLVSSCMECNSEKGERPAEEFLRWLFREHRLGAADLNDRFRALELLGSGELRPALPSQKGPGFKIATASRKILSHGADGKAAASRRTP